MNRTVISLLFHQDVHDPVRQPNDFFPADPHPLAFLKSVGC
jgi:hypothetical protein